MMSAKKKILVFVDWFYPGYKGGGPIRSCVNLLSMLKNEYTIKVVTRNADLGDKTSYPGIASNQWVIFDEQVQVMYLSPDKLSFVAIKDIFRQEKPDHIYLNSMYSKYFTIVPLLVKKVTSAPTPVTIAPRGMLYDSAVQKKIFKKKIYLFLFKRIIGRRAVQFHATNKREVLSIRKYFPDNPVYEADNVPTQQQRDFRSCIKNRGELKCVFIARIDKIKNLLLLLELLKNVRARVELTVIGPIEDNEYWEQCKKAMDALPKTIRVSVMGAVSHDEIYDHLVNAHLFVLLTRGENFGHSIFESFLAGRPVLISDQTPWRDLESQQAGWDIALSDTDCVIEKLNVAADWDQETFDTWANAAWKLGETFLKNNKAKDSYLQMFG